MRRLPLSLLDQNSLWRQHKIGPKVKFTFSQNKLGKRKAPVNCTILELTNNIGEKQIHPLFKEDETCFTQYDLYNVQLKDTGCDNDCPTDDDQIMDSKRFIFSNLLSALREVNDDITRITNYNKFNSIKEIKAKRLRVF